MTGAVVRLAEAADLPAIARLRRELTAEQEGDRGDPDFEGEREIMFEGFTLERIDVGDAELRVRHGGSGPAVLLLHGHPRTHVTWHKVAPLLAELVRFFARPG